MSAMQKIWKWLRNAALLHYNADNFLPHRHIGSGAFYLALYLLFLFNTRIYAAMWLNYFKLFVASYKRKGAMTSLS
jgi:hypothetical protein